jgi:hypothetical protein
VLNLYPSQWIEQPTGYEWAGIKALLENEGQGLKGALEIQGCGALLLWKAGTAPGLPEQSLRSAEAASPPAKLEFNEELMKLNREVFELNQAGEYEKALAKANEALAIAERVYGPDHPTAAAELRFAALVLMAAGRSVEAEPAIRRALAIDEKVFGRDNPTTAFDLQILSGVLLQTSLKNNQPPDQGKRVLLTGQLPGILMKAVPLALIASALLLWIYRRAVKRSMGRRAGAPEGTPPSEGIGSAFAPPAATLEFVAAENPSGGGWRGSIQGGSAWIRRPLAERCHLLNCGSRLCTGADRCLPLRRGPRVPSGQIPVHCLGKCVAHRADDRTRRAALLAGVDCRRRDLRPPVRRRLRDRRGAQRSFQLGPSGEDVAAHEYSRHLPHPCLSAETDPRRRASGAGVHGGGSRRRRPLA